MIHVIDLNHTTILFIGGRFYKLIGVYDKPDLFEIINISREEAYNIEDRNIERTC